MDLLISLNDEVKKVLKEHFNSQDVLRATRLLEDGKDSISFKKGTPDRYFVVSGILQDDHTEETKISFKKDESGIKIKSQCTCLLWSEEKHCPHSAALFLRFHLLNKEISDLPDTVNRQRIEDNSVTVSEFGTMIDGPEKLRGRFHKAQATYFAYNYKLVDGTVVNFPIPKAFGGKLILELFPTYKFFLKRADIKAEEIPKSLFTPRFSIVRDDKIIKEVSLFESLYIFDWTTGESFHIPKDIFDFLKHLKRFAFSLDVDDFLNQTADLRSKEIIDIQVEGKDIKEIPREVSSLEVKINESEKKNYLNLKIYPKIENSRTVPLPKIYRYFAFENGLFGTFNKKNQAYELVSNLYNYHLEIPNKLMSLLRYSSSRNLWEDALNTLLNKPSVESCLPSHDKIIVNSNKQFLEIIFGILKHFEDQSFRFSSIDLSDGSLNILIRKSKILEGIADFYSDVAELGVKVFYNNKSINTWRSNIVFSRQKSDIDWFGLDLELGKDDLDIIKKAELDSTHVITQSGLTLFTAEQKSLLRFMKKYVNYEKTEAQTETNKKMRFQLPFKRSRIFELFELKKLGIEGILTDEEEAFCEKLLNLDGIPEYSIPDRYDKLLRPYQRDGFNWLNFLFENRFGACLADDMGLGKTLQTISFLESIQDQVKSCLIVCPISILMNWQSEFEKFSTLKDEIHVYYGGDRQFRDDKKIILTSYGVMKKEANNFLKEKNFDIFVLDEVQNLKNVRSLGATAAREINSKFRVCLTGTPVENDLSEFYNIMDLAVPGIWGNADYLRTKSVKKSRLIAKKSARPFILRRTKKEVLKDLPPKTENLVYLRFSEKERENYILNLTKIRTRINSVLAKRKYGEVLKGLLELRQMCLWQKSEELLSTKIKYLMKNIEQVTEEGHKALIFSQFTTYLDLIEDRIKEKNIPFSRIDGSFNLKKRNQNIENFQNGDNKVFLISLKAGGLGLNLTAASYIYLMDPWWNPAVENQAIDRAHRIGQKNALNVYRLIMKDSIEEKVLKLQELKKDLFNELLTSQEEGEQYFTGKLSMKDFEMLLSPTSI